MSTPKRSLGLGGFLKGRSQVALAKAMTYGVGIGLVGVAIIAVLAFIRPPAKAAAVHIPEPTVAAEGFAQLFVTAWLNALPGDSLAPFWPGSISYGARTPLPGAGPAPLKVFGSPAAVDAVVLGPDYWSITVGALVGTTDSGPATARFYRVPVARSEPDPSGARVFVAADLPSPVAGPVGARAPELAVGSLSAPGPNDPVSVAVSRFLGALLTGNGELTRYMAPESTVRAIRPIPFTGVDVTEISARRLEGDAKHLEVVVHVSATDGAGRLSELAYPLEVRQRDGRWEVVRIIFAPALAPHQDALARPLSPPVAVATTSTTVAPATTTSTTSTIPSSSTTGPTTTTRRT